MDFPLDPASGDVTAGGYGPEPKAPELPSVADDESFKKLPHGSAFKDPTGATRYKPIRNNEDYLAVPEGAKFADPSGKIRTKPKYEGIDFTPQALYDIAHSDKGRKMALEKFYPGKVKEDPTGGFYIEDEGGKLRKPGRGLSKITGAIAADVVPTVLATGGGLLGGAVGTLAEPGGGTVVGGAAGGYGGGYMGQRFNDIISQLAGVYDPEGAESNARMAGYVGAAGDVGGRAVSAALPIAKEGVSQLARGASKTVNKFLGTDEEALRTAVPIAEAGEQPGQGIAGLYKPGTAVSPSAIFKSSPHLTNVAEILQQKFDKSDTYLQNAERYMDKKAKDILASNDIGALVEGSLTNPTAAVDTAKAGKALQDSAQLRAVQQSAEADKLLQEELARRKGAAQAAAQPGIDAHLQRNDTVTKAAEQAARAASDLVQEGFRSIEKEANDAFTVAKAGYNSGDLWRQVAQKFVSLRAGIQQRASKMYTDAEEASGGLVPPGARSLSTPAWQLLDELPENFESMHPSIVRKLRDMGGIKDPKTGEWVKEPVDATWVQLHNLRSMIKQNIKWNDLTSDIKNGTLKLLTKRIDEVLHPIEESAHPQIKEASQLLKLADAYYHEHMGPLNNQQLKSLVKALEVGGIQADPKMLLKIALRDGQTEVANTIKRTVGPETWNAMRAADVKDMLAQSQQLGTNAIDGVAFARQVLDRKRNGVLEVLHGDGAGKLEQQASYIEQLRGKTLQGAKLDITPKPGDTANDIILRARAAAADAEKLAKEDPIKALANEMKKIEAATRKEFAANRKPDPLAFLTNSTVGANAAVDKLLGDPDLIVAAARSFPGGEKSPEFQLLRQVWAQRFLTGTLDPGAELAKTSDEIQQLMFPGVSRADMHMLAKEMDLLMSGHTMRGGDVAGGMMAQAAVENPFGRASGLGKLAGPAKLIPGANFGARAALTAYYNGVRALLTSPSTLRWLRKGLQSRDPAERASARAAIASAAQRGGAMGAGGAEATYEASGQ